MNVIKEIQRINEVELKRGTPENQSWHADYKDSAWVFVGGLPYNLTEGDVICVFSQWGEIEDVHLVRDEQTGKAKGFAFIKYEDQRSTNLVVDNANGTVLLGRTLRVDHKQSFEAPKKKKAEIEADPTAAFPARFEPGLAYKGRELASGYTITEGVDLFKPAVRPGGSNSAAGADTATPADEAPDGEDGHRRRHRHHRHHDAGDGDAGGEGEPHRRHRHRHHSHRDGDGGDERGHRRRHRHHSSDSESARGADRGAGRSAAAAGEARGRRRPSASRSPSRGSGRGGPPRRVRGDDGDSRGRPREPYHGREGGADGRAAVGGSGDFRPPAPSSGSAAPLPPPQQRYGVPPASGGGPAEPPPARSWRGRLEVAAPPAEGSGAGRGATGAMGGSRPGGGGGPGFQSRDRDSGAPGGGALRPPWSGSYDADHVAGMARRR